MPTLSVACTARAKALLPLKAVHDECGNSRRTRRMLAPGQCQPGPGYVHHFCAAPEETEGGGQFSFTVGRGGRTACLEVSTRVGERHPRSAPQLCSEKFRPARSLHSRNGKSSGGIRVSQ